jgi:hypothetical protein
MHPIQPTCSQVHPDFTLHAVKSAPQQDNATDCGWFTVARMMDLVGTPKLLGVLVRNVCLPCDIVSEIPVCAEAISGGQSLRWNTTVRQAQTTIRTYYSRQPVMKVACTYMHYPIWVCSRDEEVCVINVP